MFNEDRSTCVVFNGEIYNFRSCIVSCAHRSSLRHQERYGDDRSCLRRVGRSLRRADGGMFAFAIWDDRERRSSGADRLGIKPLFIADYGGRFYFASEIKAILADPLSQGPGLHGHRLLLFPLLHSGAADRLRRIHKLLPGHTLTLRRAGQPSESIGHRYCPNRERSEESTIEEMMALLTARSKATW